MKTGSLFAQPYQALLLKVVGLALIVSTLLDYLVLVAPPSWEDSAWLTSLIKEYMSRGAVPLLGMALLVLGVWLDRDGLNRDADLGGRLPKATFFLSALLSLLFVVMAPLYFISKGVTSSAQIQQINDQAKQQQQQFSDFVDQQLQRVNSLLSNKAELAEQEQYLDSLDLSAEQEAQRQKIKAELAKVKSDPKALEQKAAKAREQGKQEVETAQQAALVKLQSELWRDRIYIPISSLLLAAGYAAIAWTGLSGSTAKAPKSQRRS